MTLSVRGPYRLPGLPRHSDSGRSSSSADLPYGAVLPHAAEWSFTPGLGSPRISRRSARTSVCLAPGGGPATIAQRSRRYLIIGKRYVRPVLPVVDSRPGASVCTLDATTVIRVITWNSLLCACPERNVAEIQKRRGMDRMLTTEENCSRVYGEGAWLPQVLPDHPNRRYKQAAAAEPSRQAL